MASYYSMKTVAIFFIIIASTAAGPSCPPGQEYNSCGSACPPTCGQPPAEACTEQCVAGCFCPSGQYKDANGNCVTSCTGSTKNCPPNEIWSDSSCGTPPKCQTPTCPNNTNKPQACTAICRTDGGCVCKKGYYRDNNYKCVLLADCNKPTVGK